eukprot:TRINITY_DN181_c1_g1_i1.p1 TRINITY_DN181_c1_g1~~TRINITY_DN181_c1_g1_i1.p1  ORF type:complete len:456 (+),score=144.43 TRINITY_DN181_c1_g1_i1:95-1462(+)
MILNIILFLILSIVLFFVFLWFYSQPPSKDPTGIKYSRLPSIVLLINGFGRLFHKLTGKHLVNFSFKNSLKEARKNINAVPNEKDPSNVKQCERYFELFHENFKKEKSFSLLGRIAANKAEVRDISNAIRLMRELNKKPEILSIPIKKPIFIIGLPRTGSTFLYFMFGRDRSLRTTYLWEMSKPFPAPKRENYFNDPRIQLMQSEIEQLNKLVPDMARIHSIDARLPEEDLGIIKIFGFNFMYLALFKLKQIHKALATNSIDFKPLYHFHKMMMQWLLSSWEPPANRVVLKSPMHTFFIEEILSAYPDACFVQLHRPVNEVIASCCSLGSTLGSIYQDKIDLGRLGRSQLNLWKLGIEKSTKVRQSLPADVQAERFLDIKYKDLTANPIETIKSIYTKFDIPWTEEAENSIIEWNQLNPQNKHGRHNYSLEPYGIDEEECNRIFADYNKQYLQNY